MPFLIFVPLGVLAALRVFDPFDGDQALFLLGSRMLDGGAVLYRDFWDIKQPGIFWFYELAGSLFGFTQQGVRLFELIWLLAFGVVLIVTLPRFLDNRWPAIVAPVAYLGTYFGCAPYWELTQVEVIAPLPIYLSAFFLAKDYEARTSETIGFAVAGSLAAAAVVFKLAFALIFIPLLGLAIARRWSGPGWSSALLADALRLGLSFALGVSLVLALVTSLFAVQGALEPFLWTMFVFPLQMVGGEVLKAPVSRLLDLAMEGVARAWPWMLLALAAVVRCGTRREPLMTRLMVGLMVAWAVMGALVIVLQRWSWWFYHLPLVLAPICVLAARGTDLLYTRLGRSPALGRLRPLFVLLLMLPGVLIPLPPAWERAGVLFAALDERSPVEAYRRRLSETYAWIGKDVAFLADAPAGPIYVIGNPLYYLLSGRTQAGAIHGWAWGIMPDAIWHALPDQIAATRPVFIYLDSAAEALMRQRHPEIVDRILTGYRLHHRNWRGAWYVRRDRPDADDADADDRPPSVRPEPSGSVQGAVP